SSVTKSSRTSPGYLTNAPAVAATRSGDGEQNVVATGGLDGTRMLALQRLGRVLDEPAAPPGIDSFQARGAVPPAAAKRHELVGRLPDHPFFDYLDTGRF